jgi:hypothetical protein
MVFQVPASKASIKQNRFEFQLPGSKKVHSVPLLKFLKPSLALELEDASEVAAARILFNEYLPEAFAQFEDAEQLGAFLEAWKDASGIGVGESEASADS